MTWVVVGGGEAEGSARVVMGGTNDSFWVLDEKPGQE